MKIGKPGMFHYGYQMMRDYTTKQQTLLLQNPPRYSEPAKAYFADEASEALEEFVEELLDENVITDKISVHRVDWQEVIMGFQSELESYMDKSQQPEWGDYISDLMVWRSWFKQVEKNPDGNYALRRY